MRLCRDIFRGDDSVGSIFCGVQFCRVINDGVRFCRVEFRLCSVLSGITKLYTVLSGT